MKGSIIAHAMALALVLAPSTARADADGITDLVRKDIPGIRKQVADAMALRASQGDSAALERLTALAEESPKIGIGSQYLWREVWREASRFSGREDLDFRRQLDEWLFAHLLSVDPSLRAAPDGNMFTLVRNMSGAQAEAGRLGQARQGMIMIEDWLRNGFSLQTDPALFPSIGRGFGVLEDARAREFPATYGAARRPDDPRGGWYPTDALIETTHLDGLVVIGSQNLAEGRWARAAEFAEWTRIAARHHLQDPDRNSQKAVNTYMDGWFLGHAVLVILGFEEVNQQRLEELVGDPLLKHKLNRARGKIDRMLLRNEVLAEGAEGELLERIGQLAESSAKNSSHLATDDLHTLRLKVTLLTKIGRGDDAFVLLDELITEARRRKAVTTETSLLRDWARLRIEKGQMDGVEAVLLRLLDDARRRGEKMAEPSLYFRYAELLTRSGRYEEAILVWREAIRMIEALNVYTRLPEYLARFADTLDEAGLHEDAAAMRRRAEALLADGRIYPEGVRRRTGELMSKAVANAAGPNPNDESGDADEGGPRHGPPGTITPGDPQVVLQPRALLSAPLAGRLASGTFTLSNPGALRRSGELQIDGLPMQLTRNPENGFIVGKPEHEAGKPSVLELHLGPGQQILIELAVPAPEDQASLEIELEWHGDSGDHSRWTIEPAEDGIARAVIDAGLYTENPFFASSLFHHIQSHSPNAPVNIRLVAPVAARIEAYSATTGNLLGIDANGNGSFADPGDMLASDSDNNGALDLVPGPEDAPAPDLELRVVSHQDPPAGGVEVRLQVLHDGQWIDTAIDTIMPAE